MWHHVVATREKSTGTITVYVDGELEDSLSTENIQELSSPNNIVIGANTIDSRHFKGNIAQVAVWDITISSGGVKALYNSGIPLDVLTNSGDYTTASNLKGYWRFNEGTGLTTTDASGNNNNGTINGATWTTASPQRNTVITIDPANNFGSNQMVYAAIGATLEDYSDNVNTASSITFKTAFSNLAPLPFDLVYPYDDMTIVLNRDNFLDTLYFAWNESVDPNGDQVTYIRELTGDLPNYINEIVSSPKDITTNMFKVCLLYTSDAADE